MSVVGQWRRSVLGAGGVALLLPLGLALGVALTTAFGGGDTLRALGQVFAGPAVQRGNDNGLESTKRVPQVPVRHHRVHRQLAPATPAPSSTTVPSGGGTPSSGGGGTIPSGTGGGGTGGGTGGGSTGGGGSGSGTPAPAPTPPPTSPTSQGSAVHQAGQSVADAAATLPVAGPVAGNAVQTVVDLIP